MNLKIILIVLVVLNVIFAQYHETIPTSHWIYNSINYLKVNGFFRSLEQGTEPYSRIQIARALFSDLTDSSLNRLVNSTVGIEINRIKCELRPEMEFFYSGKAKDSYVKIGFKANARAENVEKKYNNFGFFRLRGSVSLNDRFMIYYSAYLDQSLKNDPYFTGYEWRGFRGVEEQMFFSYSSQNMELKLGRDYVKWGYGKGGRLLISDSSRPFDMVSLKLRSPILSFQTVISQLDKMYNANRYLTAVRMEIKPIRNLYIGLGQAALYGGENQVLDFTLSNPFVFYSFTQDNDHKPLNEMIYFDFSYYYRKSFKLYGEILIDDFQIDHEVKSDLEPNEIGFIFGLEKPNIINNISGWIEFTQVRNRTYNVPDQRPFEKFLHMNKPIGHNLGTDFQSIQVETFKWLNNHYRMGSGYYLIRKGEGTIHGNFTEPWMGDKIAMGTGYKEKIPYGIIETTNRFYFLCHYEYNIHVQSDLKIGVETIRNYSNKLGESNRNWISEISISFDVERKVIQ